MFEKHELMKNAKYERNFKLCGVVCVECIMSNDRTRSRTTHASDFHRNTIKKKKLKLKSLTNIELCIKYRFMFFNHSNLLKKPLHCVRKKYRFPFDLKQLTPSELP